MDWNSLWAPWRIDYIRSTLDEKRPGCFLCEAWKRTDEDNKSYVVHRGEHAFIILNRYPYNNGHLMVATAEHLPDLMDLNADQRREVMDMTVLAERLIKTIFNPQGINIGMNIGQSAGAGLPGHLHVHLVPRWGGDTNFMHVVGQVRVIPQALEEVYAELKAVLPKLISTEQA